MKATYFLLTGSWTLLLALPTLYAFRYFFLVNDSFGEISGFLSKSIQIIVPLVFVSISILFFNLLFNNHQFFENKITRLYLMNSSLIYALFGMIITYIQEHSFPNYIYSKFGIFPEYIYVSLYVVVVFGISLLLISKDNYQHASNRKNLIIRTFTIMGLIYYAISPFKTLAQYTNIKNEGAYSYEKSLGEEYQIIEYLIKNTPGNATIIHQQQSQDWPLLGNQVMLRYFLFPRNLVSVYAFKIDSLELPEEVYLLVSTSLKSEGLMIENNRLIIGINSYRVSKHELVYADDDNYQIIKYTIR